jgi:hypothetical protein
VIHGKDFIVTADDFIRATKEVHPSLSTRPNTKNKNKKNDDGNAYPAMFQRTSPRFKEVQSFLHRIADEVTDSNNSNNKSDGTTPSHSNILSKSGLAALVPITKLNRGVNSGSKFQCDAGDGEVQYCFPVSTTSSSVLITGNSSVGKRSLCYELYPKFSFIRELKAQDLLVNGYEQASKVLFISNIAYHESTRSFDIYTFF